MSVKANTTARGYGAKHQKARAQQLATAYGKPCSRCGKPMVKGQLLDLDHTDDRSGYRGMAHRYCNRAAGARKGNRMRGQRIVVKIIRPTTAARW